MPEPLLSAAEIREAQATACLEAAATHRVQLLAGATRLAGSAAAGMDLFQQACLNCHDAIQRTGFQGSEYRYYLRRAIRNLHLREVRRPRPRPAPAVELASPAPPTDARNELADALHAEVATAFPELRLALHLHLAGHSYQAIAELTGGGDQSWLRRRMQKLKTHLRTAFGPAWASLNAE